MRDVAPEEQQTLFPPEGSILVEWLAMKNGRAFGLRRLVLVNEIESGGAKVLDLHTSTCNRMFLDKLNEPTILHPVE